MSYIDSQIRELREIAEMYEGMDGGELLKECADTIESLYKKLNEKNNGGWIPCSERLPEDGVKVLVWFEYFRYGEYNRLFQTIGISYAYNGKWSGFVNDSSGWSELSIFAWQPLPEAYHG